MSKHKYTAICKICNREHEADKINGQIRLVMHTCKRSVNRGVPTPGSEKRQRISRSLAKTPYPIFIVLSCQAYRYYMSKEQKRIYRTDYYRQSHSKYTWIDWNQYLDAAKILGTEDVRNDIAVALGTWSRPYRIEKGWIRDCSNQRHVLKHDLDPLVYLALMELADEHEVRHRGPGALVSNYLEGIAIGSLKLPR